MTKLLKSEKVSLKNHPEIKEDLIQKFIYDNPSVLGLGELVPLQREKIQPTGGRLDLLFGNQENDERYEVEIQLGSTDPHHIIRTIEYWDIEKKRYPKYNHCAVIVAEEITGRFQNVISLFNGSIPLIALQMSAIKHGEDIEIVFTKVLDRVILGSDEDDETAEVTDRPYWEKRTNAAILKEVDSIFKGLELDKEGYELKYNKFYIGLAKNGLAKNFVLFMPKKAFVKFCIKVSKTDEFDSKIDEAGLENEYKDNRYVIRFDSKNKFDKHKELISELVAKSKDDYNA